MLGGGSPTLKNTHKFMIFNANPQQSAQNSPWWASTKDGLTERIQKVQKINDPTTSTDEVMRGARWLVGILLIFTGALGGLSYFKFFSQSFPFELSVIMALLLTIAIEWGKNRALKWTIRIPLFQGWSYIGRTPENTIFWLGSLLIALATFSMSIYNSTLGGRQLSLMMSQEKNHTTFVANTADIDAQITATQATISNAPMAKWKGRMYYQEPRAVRAAQKTVESLQRQRETTIAQQRADWEATRDEKKGNASFAAGAVLAAGGWVEGLQLLLILLVVACEKKLDGRTAPTPQRTQVNGYHPGNGQVQHQQPVQNHATFRPIGFNVNENGNVQAVVTEDVLMRSVTQPQETVTQFSQSVSQPNAGFTTIGADQVLNLLKLNLQREIPNFSNPHANNSTVSDRITRHLDEAAALIAGPGFTPTRHVAIQVWQYLVNTGFPALRQRGFPYNRENIFVDRLLQVIPALEGEGV